MGNALLALQNQYIFLTQNLSMILAACSRQEQRDAIQSQYVASRRNYFNCINKIFHDDDPAVTNLVSKMQSEQTTLTNMMNGLNDIAKVIDGITQAVKIGAQLVSAAG
ncbi:MAG: hypothetical protein ACYCPS_05275 [Candidatus Saccharimonadales bacterium]